MGSAAGENVPLDVPPMICNVVHFGATRCRSLFAFARDRKDTSDRTNILRPAVWFAASSPVREQTYEMKVGDQTGILEIA